MLKQGQYQKLLQKLSPQQIQLMKLLQVPTAQLEERIKEELEVNPALEEGSKEEDVKSSDDTQQESETELPTHEDDVQQEDSPEIQDDNSDMNEYTGDDDDPADYKLKDNNYPDESMATRGIPIPVQRTFQEFLENQLGMLDLDEHQHLIAEQIIGNIDDDGYLRRPLGAVVDDIAFSVNEDTTVEELQYLLEKIQQFDPPGTGARDLKECLLIQLNKKGDHSEIIEFAIKVITDHFDEFIKKHYDKLQKHLNIGEETFKKVIHEITHLNPKPGSAFSESSQPESFIVPDFFITNNDGKLELSLNARNAPELRISEQYREIMREYEKGSKKDKKQRETAMFIPSGL
jgi:RNA polymerase sigma-54 factor